MFLTLGAIVGRLLHRERVCPKCGKKQVIPSEMKHKTVSCKFCGVDIPPRK